MEPLGSIKVWFHEVFVDANFGILKIYDTKNTAFSASL